MKQQQNQLHPLYIEQQQWFQQFYQPQYQQQHQQNQLQYQQTPQLYQLHQMGFKDHKKNFRLLKRFGWNIDQVIQAQMEDQQKETQFQQIDIIQIVKNTKLLYIDCNNIKYACKKWDKFRGSAKKQIKKIIKVILKWIKVPQHQLFEIYLIWDVFNMQKIERLLYKLVKFKMINSFSDFNKQDNKVSFIFDVQGQKIKTNIQSAYPQIADDLIFNLCSSNLDNKQSTVVTSDKELRKRLQQAGIDQFIGNGLWWKLKYEFDRVLVKTEKNENQPNIDQIELQVSEIDQNFNNLQIK